MVIHHPEGLEMCDRVLTVHDEVVSQEISHNQTASPTKTKDVAVNSFHHSGEMPPSSLV